MKRFSLLAAVLLAAAAALSQVTVSAPANNSHVGTPTQFVASAHSDNGSAITALRIYVDNNSVFFTSNSSLNTSLELSPGQHYTVVQAWDARGQVYKTPVEITVAGGGQNVVVTTPANGSTVDSPVQVVAQAHGDNGAQIVATRIYVDNNSVFFTPNGNVNTSVSMSGGGHSMVVQAWDANGKIYKTQLNLTVSGGGGGIPGNAQLIDNIDQMSGWQNCDVCAGPGGHGFPSPHSLTQWVGSPSMDGQSAQYWLGGSRPYGSALWWKQLGARSNASNFAYDLYFYSNNPGAAQALEFDVNQSAGGKKFIFGTQCNIKGSHQWDVWNRDHWQPTGVGCGQPSAYTWHHLVWQFRRSGAQVVFVSVTLDGHMSYINRSYAAIGSGVQELNAAVQLDGDSREEDFSIWVDRMKLYYW